MENLGCHSFSETFIRLILDTMHFFFSFLSIQIGGLDLNSLFRGAKTIPSILRALVPDSHVPTETHLRLYGSAWPGELWKLASLLLPMAPGPRHHAARLGKAAAHPPLIGLDRNHLALPVKRSVLWWRSSRLIDDSASAWLPQVMGSSPPLKPTFHFWASLIVKMMFACAFTFAVIGLPPVDSSLPSEATQNQSALSAIRQTAVLHRSGDHYQISSLGWLYLIIILLLLQAKLFPTFFSVLMLIWSELFFFF